MWKYIPLYAVLVLFVIYVITLNSNTMLSQEEHSRESKGTRQDLRVGLHPRPTDLLLQWKNCMQMHLNAYETDSDKLWTHFCEAVEFCENLPNISELRIRDFNNRDESKRHILPLQKNGSVIVTLGIGGDTESEESLLKELPVGSLFYGADPIIDGNERLYSRFGTYFPFAIGGKSGIYNASVLDNGTSGSYKERSVVHIGLPYFLSNILPHKVYDNLWIDAEGGEYEMFPAFYRDDQLDQSGITVCQFNMEVHSPNSEQKEMFRKFVFQMIRDSRYAFFRAVAIAGHIRLFAVNFDAAQCVAEYIAPADA